MEHTFTIAEVAKKNGLSAKTIQNTIKANPQLGIVMKARVKTVLTYEQAAQISALVADKRAQFSEKKAQFPEKGEKIPSFSQNSGNSEVGEFSQLPETAKENSELEELRERITQLTVDLAVSNKENEMLRDQVIDLKEQRENWRSERMQLQASIVDTAHSLESAEAKASRAAAQVDSLKEGVDAIASAGLFARARMARELSARAGKMLVEEGE